MPQPTGPAQQVRSNKEKLELCSWSSAEGGGGGRPKKLR